MIHPTIQVLYTCAKCGLTDAKVTVVARVEGEDISDWMDKLTAKLAADHDQRSPHCHVTSLTYVKVPIGLEGSMIGAPVNPAKKQ